MELLSGESRGRTYPYPVRQHHEPRPTDHTDAVQDIEPETSQREIATHIGQLKGDANAFLSDANYERLELSGWRTPSLRWRLRR